MNLMFTKTGKCKKTKNIHLPLYDYCLHMTTKNFIFRLSLGLVKSKNIRKFEFPTTEIIGRPMKADV